MTNGLKKEGENNLKNFTIVIGLFIFGCAPTKANLDNQSKGLSQEEFFIFLKEKLINSLGFSEDKANQYTINIMNPDASLNDNVPNNYKGLDRYDARKQVIQELDSMNLLDDIIWDYLSEGVPSPIRYLGLFFGI